MAVGDPHSGLLKAIIDVMRQEEPDKFIHYLNVTNSLKAKGQWGREEAKTPDRTVNSYLSQNMHIFGSDGDGSYYLKEAYRLK